MKKISFTLLAFIAFFAATAQHIATFDDLNLPPASYWDGSSQSGGFLDGDAYFTNSYDTAYGGYWSGFAYSNVPYTDTVTSSSNEYSYQYQSAAGSGAVGSSAFGICNTGSNPTLRLKGFAPGHPVYGMFVTNSAYDYISMKFGDNFAKKFGGSTGMDSDWFRLTITGWYQGAPIANSVDVYLADFRSPDTSQHYILKSWEFVNLLSLGNVDSLTFILNSSDTAGGNGMNTPAYFDLDNFTTTDGATVSAPIAVNDSFAFVYMDTLTGNADTLVANILANDTVSASIRYTVSLISSPYILGAIAYLDSNNELVYIPAAGVTGTDTLYYSLCDQTGNCDTAQILIYVQSPLNTTGIADLNKPELHLYPNPAASYIAISYASAMQSVSIIDMSGREVLQKDINTTSASVYVLSLSPGIYTVMVHTNDGTFAKRLVKE